MKHFSWALAVPLVLASTCGAARADILVLDPGISPFDGTNIGVNVDRGDAFDALANFSITSAGIFFDPLDGGATGVAANIYEVQKDSGVGSIGSLVATGSAMIGDSGLTFYDVPLSFDFVSGNRYYLAFTADGANGWGFGINNMRFFNFNFPDSPFTVGDVSVVDGGCFGVDCAEGFDNTVMPLIRLQTTTEGDGQSTVPEPSGAALSMLLLTGMGIALWRQRARTRNS
jgi:hypothetical protein